MVSWVPIETDLSNSMISLRIFSSIILSCYFMDICRGEKVLESLCDIDLKHGGIESLQIITYCVDILIDYYP